MTAHEHLEKYNPLLKEELQKVRRRGEVCKEMQRFADQHFKEEVKEIHNDLREITYMLQRCYSAIEFIDEPSALIIEANKLENTIRSKYKF